MESPNPKQAAPPNARHDTGAGPDTQPSGAASTEKSALAFLAPPQAPDELGRLGPYRILGELGHGGMGMVFRAEDPQLKRQIALKVMLPQYAANPLAMKRFLREAEAQAAVEHDHIIPIFQVGEDRGTPFIAMPLLKGQTLAAALKAAPRLPISEVIRIGREMAEGLAAAHEKGLIHRDIKPGNVWLEGERRRVKILDFGLARAEAEQSAEGDEPITASGTIVGTPSYMSPEQARALPVDFRTDLFSLGVVLYQMATGHLPFTGANTMAILTALAVDTPRPPRELNREIPATLNDLIQQLLAKNPSQRPHSAHAVAEDLRQHELAMSVAVQAIPLGALPEAVPEVWSQIADTETNEVVHRPAPAVRKPAPVSREAQPSVPRRGTPIWVWAVAAMVGFLAVVGGAVVVFQQVTKVTTPKGTLIIESSDPDVEVIVKKDGVVLVDKTKQREIELKVGDGYTIELAEKKDGLRLNTDKFTITKDGKSTVKVFVEKPIAAKPKADADRRVAEWVLRNGGLVELVAGERYLGSVAAGGVLPAEPYQVYTIQVTAGTAVDDAALDSFTELRRLGKVILWNQSITEAGLARFLASPAAANLIELSLIDDRIGDAGLEPLAKLRRLTEVRLNCLKVTDASLLRLRDAPLTKVSLITAATGEGLAALQGKKLTVLSLRYGSLVDASLRHLKDITSLDVLDLICGTTGDAGLAHLTANADLTQLSLNECKVTGAGLDHVARFRKLTHLSLFGLPIGDDDLPKLKPLTRLQDLNLSRTKLTDAGLLHLEKATTLTALSLKETKVTEAGVKKLAAALPRCRITWDGPTIEPIDPNKLAEADFPALEAKSKAAGVTFASFAKDVNDFKVKHGGTPSAIKAAELLMKLPSPLDALDPAKIPDDAKAAWKAAGFDGKDVVAVLGEHRRRHWGDGASIALSPNGKMIASVGLDHVIRLWGGETFEELANWPRVGAAAPAFSPDNKTLAVATDKGVFRCDVSQPQPQELPMLESKAPLWALAFSPERSLLAAVGGDQRVHLWDLTDATPKPLPSLPCESAPFRVSFTRTGETLVTGEQSGHLTVWDVPNAKPARRFQATQGAVFSLSLSPDGRQALACDAGGEAALWDIATGAKGKTFAGAKPSVLSPTGLVLTRKADNTITLYNQESGAVVRDLRQLPLQTVVAAAFSADGKRVVLRHQNGTIRLWDVATGKEVLPLTGPVGAATSVAWSPDGANLAVANTDLTARYWNVAERRIDGTIPLQPSAYPPQVRFTPAGDAIAINSPLALWSTQDKKLTKTYAPGVSSLAISPDGRRIAGAKGEEGATVWDVASGSQVVNVGKQLNPLGVAFDPTGTRLATGWNQVGIYDAATGSPIAEPTLKGADLRDLAFSPNGTLLYGQNAYLDLRTLQYQSTGAAVFCGFSPDGRLFASRTGNMLAIHDTAQPSVQHKFNFPGPINAAAFAPDGRHLATANGNGTVYILRLPKPQVMVPEPAALAFDGKTTHVRLPFSPTDAAPYTVEAWVKFDAPTSTGYTVVACAFNPGRGISLYRTPDGTIRFGERVGRGQDISGEPNPASHTGWVHVAGVWDGKTSRVYVNGVKQPIIQRDELPQMQIDAQNQSWMLGATQPVPGEPMRGFFAGQMREVRFSMGVRYDKDFTPATRHEPDKETYALYRCDDGQGDELKDSSGGNRHGKIVGATWVKPTAARGLQFDGKTAHVVIHTLSRDEDGPITIEAFVTVAQTQGANLVRLEGKFPCQMHGWPGPNGATEWVPNGIDHRGLKFQGGTPALTPGKRTHVAFQIDGESIRLFIDGKLANTAPRTTSAATSKLVGALIGAGGDPAGDRRSDLFAGTLDEIRISKVIRYKGDFTPTQRHEPDKDTLALYHCDDGQGDKLTDSSGNGHHGKIVGATWVRAGGPTGVPARQFALEFHGVKDIGMEPLPFEMDPSKPFTIEAYCIPGQTGHKRDGSWPIALEFAGLSAQKRQWNFWMRTKSDGYNPSHQVITPANENVETHVAGVFTGRELRLYVNGKLTQKKEVTGVVPRAVGRPITLGVGYAGTLREVRISKVARYDADFSPTARHEPDKDTLALYHCDEGTGDKLTDSSGNGHHGKIVGATWVTGGSSVPAPEQANAAKALGVSVQIENSIGMKLNLIPAGKFLMGSPDGEAGRQPREGPQHEVAVTRAFYIGVHEVTVGQFKAFVNDTNHKTEAERNGAGAVRRIELTPGTTWQTPGFAQFDSHPVTCISWNDAVAFCQWLSKKEGKTYRLPTEAEWEYACRAGSQTPYYFGVDAPRLTEHAWIEENSQGATHPVGQLLPNAWGLFDLLGNVWEWCADWYSDAYYANSPKTDPKGPDTGTIRANRGGGWPHPSVVHRSARRNSIAPDYRSWAGGFRVVCELRPATSGTEPKK